ncbi:MAG: hypothetical protein ACO1G4_07380, partial [Bacteroidota bacterium]
MRKRIRLYVAVILVGISAFSVYSFSDDYFEISRNLDIFATLFRELNIYYVDETNYYVIMEYVSGGELYDTISKWDYYDEHKAAYILKQILSA